MRPAEAERTRIDILMQKYALLREEIMFHFKTAKTHTKYFQAFFAAGLVIGWYLFFLAEPNRLTEVLGVIGITHRELLILVLLALNITSFYFAFDVLDCYFCIFLAAGRLANIEQQINKELSAPVLIWESKFQMEDAVRFGSSRVAVTGFQWFLVGLVACFLPLFVYYRIWLESNYRETLFIIAAAAVCVTLSAAFAYTCYDVLFVKREQPIQIVDRIISSWSKKDDTAG